MKIWLVMFYRKWYWLVWRWRFYHRSYFNPINRHEPHRPSFFVAMTSALPQMQWGGAISSRGKLISWVLNVWHCAGCQTLLLQNSSPACALECSYIYICTRTCCHACTHSQTGNYLWDIIITRKRTNDSLLQLSYKEVDWKRWIGDICH